ncbi:hypothetical protein HS99_0026990 [Kitasatospora aureofaciens]|uniref:Uncharacterized protein n=1 Tax=Kitasatospora aureofaciens TaxID=1894 RepID=A0A1E7N884_KITAU|nr:hypothetical protein HS99_0026990 [Kitasatospora aureofaciens]
MFANSGGGEMPTGWWGLRGATAGAAEAAEEGVRAAGCAAVGALDDAGGGRLRAGPFGGHLVEQTAAGEGRRAVDAVRREACGESGGEEGGGGAPGQPFGGERFEGRAVGGGEGEAGVGKAETGERRVRGEVGEVRLSVRSLGGSGAPDVDASPASDASPVVRNCVHHASERGVREK